MRAADGGIRIPMVPPAATVPAAKPLLYLNRRMGGIETLAMVAAVATDDPEMAAKPPQAATVAIARPPRLLPSQALAAS